MSQRFFPVSFILLFLFLSSCHNQDYETIEKPLNSFSANFSDKTRGATSIQDLSCYLFMAFQGDMSFEQLSKFIPDSAEVADMYALTGESSGDADLKAIADSANHALYRNFIDTRSKPAVLHASWSEATYEKLMVFDLENQKLPSKRIIMEAYDGKTPLRASVMCLQIGNRWFLGEQLRFGV